MIFAQCVSAGEVSCMFLTGVDRILGMKVILQMTTGGMKLPLLREVMIFFIWKQQEFKRYLAPKGLMIVYFCPTMYYLPKYPHIKASNIGKSLVKGKIVQCGEWWMQWWFGISISSVVPPNGFKVKFHEISSGKRAISCNTHCTLYIYALICHDCAIFFG